MTLLRALSMPLQPTSLMFVGFSAALLALIWGVAGIFSIAAIVGTFFLVSWLNKYAYSQLEQAAQGVADAPVASAEMLGPFGGARPWVHPVLAAGGLLLMSSTPAIGRAALGVAALVLFPASVGALAVSQRLIDAVNPLALKRVIVGMGWVYLVLVAAEAVVVISSIALIAMPLWSVVSYAALELLMLYLYTLIGGALFVRRVELGFEPLASPEHKSELADQAQAKRRQQMIDEVYGAARVREAAQAVLVLKRWLAAAPAHTLQADVPAILGQALLFPEQRGLPTVARTLISHLVEIRRLSLALSVMDTVATAVADFTPESEAEVVALAQYAILAGRRTLARSMIEQWVRFEGAADLGVPARKLSEELAR
jgi:hypothetical protein